MYPTTFTTSSENFAAFGGFQQQRGFQTHSFPTLVQTPVTPDEGDFEFLAEDFNSLQPYGAVPMIQQPNHQHQRGRRRNNNFQNSNNGNICKFFANGNCTKGQNCNWTHLIPTAGMGYGGPQKNVGRAVYHRGYGGGSRSRYDPSMGGGHPSMGGGHPSMGGGHPSMGGGRSGRYQNVHQAGDPMQDIAYMNVRSASELEGEILRLSRQQVGCRLLQRLLEADEPGRLIILNEVFSSLNTLVIDPFGHHLVLRLLDFVTYEDRMRILIQLNEDLVAVSLNVHGTRVVQKLLECMENTDEFELVEKAFEVFVITLAKDVYGMHVVLRCLHRIPAPSADSKGPDNTFIFREITRNIVSVATHKHGCCVVQWCIDYANVEQRASLVNVIVENALELAQDAFGNYVLQQIMDTAQEATLKHLIRRLKGSMSKLAVQKFSSIVVEKCVEMAPKELRKNIYDEIINEQKISRLLQDPYANYVIQKILTITRQEEFHEIVAKIQPHLNNLGNTPFGKRIKTQMIRKFPILSMGKRRADPLKVPAPVAPVVASKEDGL